MSQSLRLVPARHGPRDTITNVKAAEAASLNLRSVNPDRLADLTIDIIEQGINLNRRTQRTWDSIDPHKRVPPTKERTASGLDAKVGYVMKSISPSGNDDVIDQITSRLFEDDVDAHAEDLNNLHADHPTLYRDLLDGRLRSVASHASRGAIAPEALQRLLERQARLLLIGKAHDLVRVIRMKSTAPFGDRFSGFNYWKNAGHVMLTTLAAPASNVQRLCSAHLSNTIKAEDDNLWDLLIKKDLLPATREGRMIFDVAREVQRRSHSDEFAKLLSARMVEIFHCVDGAARLDSKAMAEEGLARQTFVELDFGLSASEAATFVAVELLKALASVSTLVSAVIAGDIAKPHTALPNDEGAGFVSAILRCESKPDKESSLLGRARGGDGGLDPSNGTARKPVKSLQQKLADPAIADRARLALGIDAAWYFTR